MVQCIHFRKTCLPRMLLLALAVLLVVPGVAESVQVLDNETLGRPTALTPSAVEGVPEAPQFVPGELIVKLKPGASLTELELLNRQFGVSATEPVFPKTPDPAARLNTLKQKFAALNPEHKGWHWYADRESQEAKDYAARIEQEKAELQQQIEVQETLIARLERRQQRAPEGVATPILDTTFLLKAPESANIPAMAQQYAQHPAIEYAEPNYIATIQMVPNDPYYASLWGVQKIQSGAAWELTQGQGVIVAVADTGVDYTHEDLAANMWNNLAEVPGNGKDDDFNGYTDDFYGWDFYSRDGDPRDDHGHGTHVAGTIAAVGNNNKGIIGVAPQAKIMAVKGLGADGSGSSTMLIEAMSYAVDRGADVINCSFGGFGSVQVYQGVIQYALAHGVIVVAAAGNNNGDASAFVPAAVPEAVTVGATTTQDIKAWFSNHGSVVDLAAPGVDILSLRAQGTAMGLPVSGAPYTVASGTSMAAPHVAGVVALVMAKNPTATVADLQLRVIGTADAFPASGIAGALLGTGRVNAHAALTGAPRPVLVLMGAVATDTNGDGILGSPYSMEMGKLVVTLKNLWLGAANVSATLSSSDTTIPAIPISSASFGSIPQNEQRDNQTAPLAFQISKLEDSPTEIPANFTLTTQADGTTRAFPIQVLLKSRPLTTTAMPFNPGGRVRAFEDQVVWADLRDGEEPAVYLYNFTTGRERRLSTTPGFHAAPVCHGTKVAWVHYREKPNGFSRPFNYPADIYLVDLNGGSPEMIASNILLDTPELTPLGISEHGVAWITETSGHRDIYFYAFKDRQIKKHGLPSMPNFAQGVLHLDLSGTRVVWCDRRYIQSEVFLYDFQTGQEERITNHPMNQRDTEIDGDLIVYVDERDGAYNAFLVDLKTHQETRLTSSPYDEVAPSINGGKVVWGQSSGATIFLYDHVTRQTSMVTQSGMENTRPTISPWAVLWHRGHEIMAVRMPAVATVTLLAPAGGQQVTIGSPLAIRWKFADTGLMAGAKAQTMITLIRGGDRYSIAGYGASLMSTLGDNAFVWTVPKTLRPSPGYTVFIEIRRSDPTKLITATSEWFAILSPPVDLAAHGPYAWPPKSGAWTAVAGEPVRFAVTVNNIGERSTEIPYVVEFQLDGRPYARMTRAVLQPQSSAVVLAPSNWTATAGTHTVRVVVNGDRKVTERDYANNTVQSTLVVQPRASANRPPEILYAGAFRWWGYLYAYTFARDPEDGYIYDWGRYRWSLSNGAQAPGWYLFQRFTGRSPIQATVTVTDRHGASTQRTAIAY